MLEKIDLKKDLDKENYKAIMDEADAKLGRLQRACKDKGIPIIILFDGYGAAGRGTAISRFIEPLDPRGFTVYSTTETEEDKYYPFMYKFWKMTPPKGRIHVLDGSWYRILLEDKFAGKVPEKLQASAPDEIVEFERVLTDDHVLIIKFFLIISEKEQEKKLGEEDKKNDEN